VAVTRSAAAELRRALIIRANALEEAVRRNRGPLSSSRADLRRGLDLFEYFAQEIAKAADSEYERNAPSPDAQASALTPLLQRVTHACMLLERHFAHGDRRELSESLSHEIRTVLHELELDRYAVVTSHGDPDNFITSFGDLETVLFSPLTPLIGTPPYLTGSGDFALFRIPRIEGAGLYWRPWLLGHEIAHIAVSELDAIVTFGLDAKFDYATASTIESPYAGSGSSPIQKRRALYDIARNWLTELLCDAFAVHRYGPAGVAAIGEFSTTLGAMAKSTTTHPPGSLRLQLATLHLGKMSPSRLRNVTSPWTSAIPKKLVFSEGWVTQLAKFFLSEQTNILEEVAGWTAKGYDWVDRQDLVFHLADRLKKGLPGDEVIRVGDGIQAAVDADLINAVWVARVEDSDRPIDSLARKGLDNLEFCRRWVANGGGLPTLTGHLKYDGKVVGKERGILSETALMNRMHPECSRRLMITPLLQEPHGSAVDLRLGNRFIVFRRVSVASFDPIELGSDPRQMQAFFELDWSEQFVLHPNEMVLGSSLEYLAMPKDLSALVASRSSYGRLGLLSATAVQVHPYFHGCLTLELVNLSTIPLSLSPGERIAQLVVSATDSVPDPGVEKYVCATGPEFSKVRNDDEAAVLRTFRSTQ
jgi:deoxycytidine triphosphate deaminase